MKNLVIIGSGGHGKVISEVAERSGKWINIFFLDDNIKKGTIINNRIVDGEVKEYIKYKNNAAFIVAIGNNNQRKKILEKLIDADVEIVTICDESSLISTSAKIGLGTVIMPGVIINASTEIGDGCIINTGTIVEHDSYIGNYVHLSPRVAIAGNVKIETLSWIGIGSVINNNVTISSGIIVGAGGVVVNNLEIPGIYIGLPAKLSQKKD